MVSECGKGLLPLTVLLVGLCLSLAPICTRRVGAVTGDGMISLQSDSGLVTVCEPGNDHLPVLSNFRFVQVKEIKELF